MSQVSLADCQTSLSKCDAALGACDTALQDKKEQIRLCDIAVMQATDYGTLLNVQVKERDEELGAWYRNPFIMITLGIVTGAVVSAATR